MLKLPFSKPLAITLCCICLAAITLRLINHPTPAPSQATHTPSLSQQQGPDSPTDPSSTSSQSEAFPSVDTTAPTRPNLLPKTREQNLENLKRSGATEWSYRRPGDSGQYETITLIQTENKRFPWIRVEESNPDSGNSWNSMAGDRLIVSTNNSLQTDFESRAIQAGFELSPIIPQSGLYHIRIPEFAEPGMFEIAQTELADLFPQATIEPDYIYFASITPSDPDLLARQWAFTAAPENGGIDAIEAWNQRSTASDTIIAILDTGTDMSHPELIDNLWTNPAEIAGNGIDDDQNGYVDDIHGYSFAYDTNDPTDRAAHGTHVAGIAAGRGDNAIGIAGVAWRAKIMSLKVLDDSGRGFTSDIVRGIDYARQQGAKIANASLGGGSSSETFSNAINRFGDNDGLFVAAAGNNSLNNDKNPTYPASYDSDNIISVAAITNQGQLAYFSNYGSLSVDIAAPGFEIYSTIPVQYGSYEEFSGTSMAAPMIAGALALIRAEFPQLNATETKDLLLESSTRNPNLKTQIATGGSLNLNNALRKNLTRPFYDSFSDAFDIGSGNTNWRGSAAHATREDGEPLHHGQDSDATVWLEWHSSSESGVTIFATSSTTSVNYTVYSGATLSDLQEVAAGNAEQAAAFVSQKDRAYKIAIATPSNSNAILSLTISLTPTNDQFEFAKQIDTPLFSVDGNFLSATNQTDEPTHAGSAARQSLWWQWTAPSSGNARLEAESLQGLRVAVYQGKNLATLTESASAETQGTSDSVSLSFSAAEGQVYSFALDSIGQSNSIVRLHGGILEPIEILQQPSSTSIAEGGTAILSVLVSQEVFAHYQWYRNGVLLTERNSHLLIIPSANSTDEAEYSVEISHPLGTITSAPATLKVLLASFETLESPTSQSIPVGGRGFLFGRFSNQEDVQYQWYKNGLPIIGANTPILTFENASATDSGLYHLSADSDEGFAATNKALIIVEDSTNHATRTYRPAPESLRNPIVKAGNNQFFIFDQNGNLLQSSNGQSWLKLDYPSESSVADLAFYQETLLLYTESGEAISSSNLIDWDHNQLPNGLALRKVAAGNEALIALPFTTAPIWEKSPAYRSTDGLRWQEFPDSQFNDIAYGAGTFVATRDSVPYSSKDGIEWNAICQISCDEAVLNNNVVTTGTHLYLRSNDQDWISNDGENWNSLEDFPTNNPIGSNGYFIKLGAAYPQYDYSADGISRKTVYAPYGTTYRRANSAAILNKDITLISSDGYIASSRLGEAWSLESLETNFDSDAQVGIPTARILKNTVPIETTALSLIDLRLDVFDPFHEITALEVWTNGILQATAPPEAKTLPWRLSDFASFDFELKARTATGSYTIDSGRITATAPTPSRLRPSGVGAGSKIRYLNGKYYRIADRTLFRSKDAITWKRIILPTTRQLIDIAKLGSTLIVALDDGHVLTSTDEYEWTSIKVGDFYGNIAWPKVFETNGVAYYWTETESVNGYLTQGYVVFYSTDGKNWHWSSIAPRIERIADLYAANGRLVANSSQNFNLLVSDDNGKTWQTSNNPPGVEFRWSVFFNGTFFTIGSDRNGYISTNAINWTKTDLTINGYPEAYHIVDDELFVNVTSLEYFVEDKLMVTKDLKNWASSTFPKFNVIKSIAKNKDGKYAAIADLYLSQLSGTLIFSPDGLTWGTANIPDDLLYYDNVVYAGNQFVATGPENKTSLSDNGLDWSTNVPLPDFTADKFISFKGDLYTEQDGTLSKFLDADTQIPIAPQLAFVTASNQAIAGFNAQSFLCISTDGSNFEIDSNHPLSEVKGLLATADKFFAYDYNQNVYSYSKTDGWAQIAKLDSYLLESAVRLQDGKIAMLASDGLSFSATEDMTNWQTIKPYGEPTSLPHPLSWPLQFSNNEYWLFDYNTSQFAFLKSSDLATWKIIVPPEIDFDLISLTHPNSVELLSIPSGLIFSSSTYGGTALFHLTPAGKATLLGDFKTDEILLRDSIYHDNKLYLKTYYGHWMVLGLGDLAISGLATQGIEGPLAIGSPISGKVEIENPGLQSISINSESTISLYLVSDPSTPISESNLLATVSIPFAQLGVGETTSVTFSGLVPKSISSGDAFLIAEVDSEEKTDELTNANNRYFQRTATNSIARQTLTIKLEGKFGAVSTSQNLDKIPKGAEIQLLAIPDSGSRFVSWEGDYKGIENNASLILDQDRQVTARFIQQWKVEKRIKGKGTIIQSPDDSQIDDGSVVTFTAMPATNFEFAGWTGDLSGTKLSAQHTIISNVQLTATFQLSETSWLDLYFGPLEQRDLSISSPTDDPDHDSIPNAIEFQLGTDPTQYNSSQAFSYSFQDKEITISFNQNREKTKYDWILQKTQDFTTWSEASTARESTPIDDQLEKVIFKTQLENDSAAFRLSLEPAKK